MKTRPLFFLLTPIFFSKGNKKMETINKNYIVDEHDNKIAVQIPIETFEKIEEILENYSLVQLIKENEGDEILSLHEAKVYYDKLEKI